MKYEEEKKKGEYDKNNQPIDQEFIMYKQYFKEFHPIELK